MYGSKSNWFCDPLSFNFDFVFLSSVVKWTQFMNNTGFVLDDGRIDVKKSKLKVLFGDVERVQCLDHSTPF